MKRVRKCLLIQFCLGIRWHLFSVFHLTGFVTSVFSIQFLLNYVKTSSTAFVFSLRLFYEIPFCAFNSFSWFLLSRSKFLHHMMRLSFKKVNPLWTPVYKINNRDGLWTQTPLLRPHVCPPTVISLPCNHFPSPAHHPKLLPSLQSQLLFRLLFLVNGPDNIVIQ